MLNKKSKSIDLAEKSFNSKIVREWDGSFYLDNIFMNTYILEKYKNELHFLPFTVIVIIHGKDINSEPILQDMDAGLYNNRPVNKYTRCSFTNSKKIIQYKTLYKNTDKKFVFYPVTLFEKDTGNAHAMFFLYDRIFNEVNLFDNAGYNMDIYKKYLKKFFQDIHGKSVKINYDTSIGCFIGKKVAENCNVGYNYTNRGYCVVFTLWFLEIRLKNSYTGLSNDDIMLKIYNKINNNNTKKLCKIIIGYAQFVHNITDTYELKNVNNKYRFKIFKKNTS